MKKYLQGRRGKDRVSYRLPDFIAQTGINKIRAALAEQEAAAKARRKARQRVNPSMGKMDIDYQVLHDAFFKHQTRPALRRAGELYHEGAEGEMAVAEATRAFRPGRLSAALLAALEMPDANAPPPWLSVMQRYGPPPAYPSLKVPGVNAPIPKGAAWGMHPGGWGTAPVDAMGRGVYGDVFGTVTAQLRSDEETIDRTRWGEALSDSEEEEEEAAADEAEADAEEDDGLEDEQSKKRAREAQEEEEANATKLAATAQLEASAKEAAARAAQARQAATLAAQAAAQPHQSGELFTVIKQKQNDVGGGLFAGDYTYEVTAGGGPGAAAAAALKQAAAGNLPKDKAAQQQQQQQSKKRPNPKDEDEEFEAGFKF
jgi:splicing factor 3B subunit 2